MWPTKMKKKDTGGCSETQGDVWDVCCSVPSGFFVQRTTEVVKDKGKKPIQLLDDTTRRKKH
jgi:hypothetical protein